MKYSFYFYIFGLVLIYCMVAAHMGVSAFELALYYGITLVMTSAWMRHVQDKLKPFVYALCTTITLLVGMYIFSPNYVLAFMLSVFTQQILILRKIL